VNEAEWLSCADPAPMLEHLRGKATNRKLRLFAVACFCRNWHLLPADEIRHAVEVSERYADGQATTEELVAAASDTLKVEHAACWAEGYATITHVSAIMLHCADVPWTGRETLGQWLYARAEDRAARSRTLRDIFGNPFRPVALDASCLTPTVTALASAIYDDRAFERLPILADALEEAGCDHAEVLNHCRREGIHARGCWVVDLLLGKC
jgi:hypothetical protein